LLGLLGHLSYGFIEVCAKTADLEHVWTTKKGASTYLLQNSIQKQGSVVFFELMVKDPNKKDVQFTRQTYRFNCATGDWRIIKMYDSLSSGKQDEIPSQFLKQLPDQKNIPNSESDAYYKRVCLKSHMK